MAWCAECDGRGRSYPECCTADCLCDVCIHDRTAPHTGCECDVCQQARDYTVTEWATEGSGGKRFSWRYTHEKQVLEKWTAEYQGFAVLVRGTKDDPFPEDDARAFAEMFA